MKTGLVTSACLAVVLFAGSASAADPIVIDTLGTFDTFVRPYTTNAKPPTWVPEVKVILAVDQWAAEDVLVLQLKKGKKKIGDAQTCSYYEYIEAPPGSLTNVTEKKDLVFYLTTSQAKMISSNVHGALTFDDPEDANVVLDSLKTQYYIACAGIYDSNGRLFTTYYRDDVAEQDFQLLPAENTDIEKSEGYLMISEPVMLDKDFLGTVYLWAQP